MDNILYGTPVSTCLKEKLKEEIKTFEHKLCLKVLLIGDNPSDHSYISGIKRTFNDIGIDVSVDAFLNGMTELKLCDILEKYEWCDTIHGVLVLNSDKLISDDIIATCMMPYKDVDNMSGYSKHNKCTAEAIMELCNYYRIPLAMSNVTIIGRGDNVGKPLAKLMTDANATVTLCHSKTRDLSEHIEKANIVVCAIGKAKFIDDTYFSELNHSTIVIDAGINLDEDGHLCGDVDFENVKDVVKAITPVPKGIGAITNTILAKHVVDVYKNMEGLDYGN